MSRLSLSAAAPSRFRARLGVSAVRWAPRAFTLLVWGGVAACATYWFLTLGSASQAVPAHAQVTSLESTLRGDLTRLFGPPPANAASSPAPAPAAAARFKVIGVIGSVRGGQGVALLTIDGKAPKAFAVGSVVEGDWILQSVTQTSVRIGLRQGSDSIDLSIAKLPPAATGQLPGADGTADAGTSARPFTLPPGGNSLPPGGQPQGGMVAPPPNQMPPQMPQQMPGQMPQQMPQQMPPVSQPDGMPSGSPGG